MSLKRPRNHSGPLPSHNNDARFCVDYFAKSKMPTSVEDLCGSKAADLNESSIPLLLPDGNCALESFIVDVPDPNEDSSGFSSFSSNRSDELNPTGVESSMKKLMPSSDASTIEMN
uniref:Uncharacterized protein n=1 Tax=Ciona savignyi TaxID=51511 RepID=H2ZLV6_CIOSA